MWATGCDGSAYADVKPRRSRLSIHYLPKPGGRLGTASCFVRTHIAERLEDDGWVAVLTETNTSYLEFGLRWTYF